MSPPISSIPPPDGFGLPLVISSKNPTVGFDLPVIAVNPFAVQPVMDHDGVIISSEPPSHVLLSEAINMVSSNPEKAGRRFTKARDDERATHANLADIQHQVFIEATFGAAAWGAVDTQTFADLRAVRKKAKKLGDKETIAREMLVRALAHLRIGDDEAAIDILDLLSEKIQDTKEPIPFHTHVLLMYINIHIDHAIKYRGPERSFALNSLAHLMQDKLKKIIEKAQAESRLHPNLTDSLAKIYIFVAEFLLAQRRPVDAKEVINAAHKIFPCNDNMGGLFNEDAFLEDGPSISEISPLQQLLLGKHKVSDHIVAGVTEFLNSAQFESNRAFWKYAAGGALALAGSVTALKVLFSNNPPSLANTMMCAATGAVAAVATGKTIRGLRAPETRQAFASGYSEARFGKLAIRETMKLLGLYAAFGGIIPGASILPHAMLASDHSQLHGLGSLMSYIMNSAGVRTEELFKSVSVHGLFHGLNIFWNHWAGTSYFAEAVNNGLTLPFNHPFERIFSKTSINHLPQWARTFSFTTVADAGRSIGLGLLYGYMGFSSLYYLAHMNPKASALLRKYLPRYMDYVLFPGAFLATTVAMIASGVSLEAAPVLVFWNYIIQHRHFVQGGGTWNPLRTGVAKEMPWPIYATAGGVQVLYLGPGNAIKPHVPPLSETGFLQYLWNNIEANAGMVGFLATLGVFHAVFSGLSIKQTLKAKFAKAWTYEIPANTIKLMLGWTSFLANIIGPFIKEIGLGSVVTAVYRESGGSPLQVNTFAKLISAHHAAMQKQALGDEAPPESSPGSVIEVSQFADLQKKMKSNANKMHDDGVKAALRGEAYGYLNVALLRQSIADQLITLTDVYFMEDDKRLLLRPDYRKERYTEIVYNALTDPNTSPEAVEEFFDRLRVIAADTSPELKHVRRNLIMTTIRAMAGKAHGDKIYKFFTEGEGISLVSAYKLAGILEEVSKMPRNEGHSTSSWIAKRSARKWIERHLLKPNVTPGDPFDQHPADKFYSAAAVAGRRFKFTAPFTGRTLVENGSPFSTFLLSASQSDPAFQTTADSTLFAGTIYGLLMASTKKSFMTTQDHEEKVVIPLLDLIKHSAQRVGDNRTDVRHNLLVTAWLASQGPYGRVVREWIEKNKHIYQANGIYGMLKFDSTQRRLPRSLSEKELIKQLFKKYLRSSDNSSDGVVVYPVHRNHLHR